LKTLARQTREKDAKNAKKIKRNSKRWNSENVLYLQYLYISKSKFKHFPEFFDKIYNPYKKAPKKMFRTLSQV